MNIQVINKQRFTPASTISKFNVYRFDLSPLSITATAIDYDFCTGWTFSLDDGSGDVVTYSAEDIRARLNAGSIWRKV